MDPVLGVAPLLEIGGGKIAVGGAPVPLAPQDLEVYNGNGSDLGSVTTAENVQNLLGINSTQFTVTDGTPVQGVMRLGCRPTAPPRPPSPTTTTW